MNNPESYAKHNEVQRKISTDVLKSNIDKLVWRSDHIDTLIDIGSGPGDLLMEVIYPLLQRKLQRIVCSDVNSNMLEYAKSHYQYVENSEFRLLDIQTESDLPRDLKGQFDHVVSFLCLQMVENQMKAFQNIYLLIRPEGGDCLLNIFARSPYFDAYIALSKMPKWSKYMADVYKYTSYWQYTLHPQEEARCMLQKCGFSYVDVKLHKKSMELSSVETLKTLIRSSSPYVHHMPKELHQELAEEFVEAIGQADETCTVINGSGGKFRFNFELLVIYARR